MIKRMKWGGMMLASLLVVSSCQNEEIIDSLAQGQQVTLKVGRAIGSRTALDGDKTVWSKGDKIYVSSKDGKTTGVLTLQGNGGGQTGTFSGFVFGNPADLAYSVYPAPTNGTIIDLSNISATGKLNAPMIGAINHNSDTNVAFQNQCGILYVSMNGSEGKTFQISGTDIDENNGTTTTNILKFAGSFDVTKINWSTDGTTPSLKFNGETPAIQVTNTNTAGSNSGVVYVPFYITNDIELDKVTFIANNTPMNNEPIDFTATASENFIGAVAQDKIKDLQYSETGSILPFLAQIGDKTYVSLQDAIDDAAANAEIKLLEDITLAEPAVVEQGKNVTIDLNGKTIVGNFSDKDKETVITNGGSLNLCGNGVIKNIAVNGAPVIRNSGSLVLNGVEIQGAPIGETDYPAYAVYTSGSLIVEEGTIIISDRGAINLQNGAEVTINGGEISVTNAVGSRTLTAHVIYAKGNNSKLTINDGDFALNYAAPGNAGASVICPAGATINVYGGNFSYAGTTGNQSGIFQNYMGYGAPVNVYGGTYNDGTVSKNVASGYTATNIGSKWIVTANNITPVSTVEDLATKLMTETENISVVLVNDIDLPISSLGQQTGGSGEYKLGGANTASITIDLNNHKLNITTTYWSGIGAKNADVTFTIKNGTMTSSQATGTWNSYDLTFANCNYVFENVVFDKAVALTNAKKSVTMKNVTINETHDYYALWITAEGQNVEIEELTINSCGRGIKIDNQYVSEEELEKVTLSIFNADFNTVNKAAIVVDSSAGADITLNNINIADVKADAVNAVWVDSDASKYADLVSVFGGSVIVEE